MDNGLLYYLVACVLIIPIGFLTKAHQNHQERERRRLNKSIFDDYLPAAPPMALFWCVVGVLATFGLILILEALGVEDGVTAFCK